MEDPSRGGAWRHLPHPFQSRSEPILSRAALAFDLQLRLDAKQALALD